MYTLDDSGDSPIRLGDHPVHLLDGSLPVARGPNGSLAVQLALGKKVLGSPLSTS
jgi:hypothetical protein